MNDEIKKAVDEIGESLGARMIVKNAVTVGAVKEIGGKHYGDYVVISPDETPEFVTLNELREFKKRLTELFSEAEKK